MTLTVKYESVGEEKGLVVQNAGNPQFTPAGFVVFTEAGGRPVLMMPFHRVIRVEFEDNRIAVPQTIITPPRTN